MLPYANRTKEDLEKVLGKLVEEGKLYIKNYVNFHTSSQSCMRR